MIRKRLPDFNKINFFSHQIYSINRRLIKTVEYLVSGQLYSKMSVIYVIHQTDKRFLSSYISKWRIKRLHVFSQGYKERVEKFNFSTLSQQNNKCEDCSQHLFSIAILILNYCGVPLVFGDVLEFIVMFESILVFEFIEFELPFLLFFLLVLVFCWVFVWLSNAWRPKVDCVANAPTVTKSAINNPKPINIDFFCFIFLYPSLYFRCLFYLPLAHLFQTSMQNP